MDDLEHPFPLLEAAKKELIMQYKEKAESSQELEFWQRIEVVRENYKSPTDVTSDEEITVREKSTENKKTDEDKVLKTTICVNIEKENGAGDNTDLAKNTLIYQKNGLNYLRHEGTVRPPKVEEDEKNQVEQFISGIINDAVDEYSTEFWRALEAKIQESTINCGEEELDTDIDSEEKNKFEARESKKEKKLEKIEANEEMKLNLQETLEKMKLQTTEAIKKTNLDSKQTKEKKNQEAKKAREIKNRKAKELKQKLKLEAKESKQKTKLEAKEYKAKKKLEAKECKEKKKLEYREKRKLEAEISKEKKMNKKQLKEGTLMLQEATEIRKLEVMDDLEHPFPLLEAAKKELIMQYKEKAESSQELEFWQRIEVVRENYKSPTDVTSDEEITGLHLFIY
ncbi:translation initiation factor IF-2-like [Mytilus californianus]|uniref:translation initiation factor IF-2-like n=1 Tax=Mytilus californianus TaxID=6549 RepID=UPI002245603C|nr:translation initiation factor IF-2-like [Mytilus californianus]